MQNQKKRKNEKSRVDPVARGQVHIWIIWLGKQGRKEKGGKVRTCI